LITLELFVLTIQEHLPENFLQIEAIDLHRIVPGPTLIHLKGRREPALFVSILLHGNEITGLHAVQALLEKYQEQELPRSLSLFIGNVEAARLGQRRLDGQPDYNRIWPGGEENGSPESAMMKQVIEEMRTRGVFASIDIHNNTGINPHYACVNVIDHRFFHLATLFSRTVVYFTRPTGVQSSALAELCPAVTVECGKVGAEYGDRHAMEFLDAALHLSEIPEHPVAEHDIDLFHTLAIVKVPEEIHFSFNGDGCDICFDSDLDHMNFRELKTGSRLGRIRQGSDARLEAWDNDKNDIGDELFVYDNQEILTKKPIMPSMLTLNERVIRQDCLCYVMERYRIHS
jgi:succinylglutamate desuccinylase